MGWQITYLRLDLLVWNNDFTVEQGGPTKVMSIATVNREKLQKMKNHWRRVCSIRLVKFVP